MTSNGFINWEDEYDYDNGFPTSDDNSIHNIVAALWTELAVGRMFYREETDTAVLMVSFSLKTQFQLTRAEGS